MKTLGVLLWVFVTVILKAPYSWAEPPGTVWRMDTRPEQLIFHAGFQAWGSNFNVHDHVTGESCVNRQQATGAARFRLCLNRGKLSVHSHCRSCQGFCPTRSAYLSLSRQAGQQLLQCRGLIADIA